MLAACGGSNSSSSPTAPTTPTAPSPSAAVRYTALGASDANGVGASVPCAPYTACEAGTGYVPGLARLLRGSREVTLVNLGIPAAVLSSATQALGRQYGRDIPGNFLDNELPFVPANSTLITVLSGPNDVNAIGDAALKGAGGTDVRAYLDAQIRTFGSDYDRLMQGLRSRAPEAFIILINVPNLASLPYVAGQSLLIRQGLQYISVGFTREINRQAGARVVVLDVMCDQQTYAPGSYSSDGFHPNDAGYAYLAQRLLAVVNSGASSTSSSCGQMTAVPAF
jgi:lysophospholipase L1-like esterase